MIVRVGTLSEVGKVKFAGTDGLEAVDVFSVIFVVPLDSKDELVPKDEVVELFVEIIHWQFYLNWYYNF